MPLTPHMARAYLASPVVLHWVLLEGSVVTGFLYCSHLLLRSDVGQELAVDFYRGCGFGAEEPQPVYMTREIERAPKKRVSTLLSV